MQNTLYRAGMMIPSVIAQTVFPLRCGTAQYHHTTCAVKSRSRAHSSNPNYILYVSYSTFNASNVSLVVCLHDCAIACAEYATKLTIAQRRIFLEGTVVIPVNTMKFSE